MVISFNPKFNIHDRVYPVLDDEYLLMIMNINIVQVDESGNVIYYTYDCADGSGNMKVYRPEELDLLSEVKNNS